MPSLTEAQVRTVRLLAAYAREHGLESRGAGFHNGLPYSDFADPTKRAGEVGKALRALVMPDGSVHGPLRLQEGYYLMAEKERGT